MSGGKYLTKISYVNGMRCPRLLWLTARRPDAHPSFEEKIRMDDGEQVGNLAQQWHQDLYHKAANSSSSTPKQLKKGFMPKFTKPTAPPTTPGVAVIQMDQGMGIAVEQTAAAIRNPEIQMIHEGTFFHNDVYCRIDLMHRAPLADPSAPPTAWNILEVKSKTSLDSNRDHYLRDAAIQNWVVSRHISVHKTKLVYVNNTCIGPVHRGMLKTFFVEEDVSEEIKPWVTKMAKDVERLKRVVRSEEEPQADIGNRCTTPYSCPYQGICFPDDSAMDNSIFTLPRLSLAKKKELWDSGIREITDLAKDTETTKVKQKVPPSALPYIQSCQRGEPLINKPEIKQFLKEAPFPRYYLDFETTSLPVVPWSVRPYQHIPFQVSLHTQKKHNEPAVHQGYLHMNLTNDPMSDPRTNIIQFLTKWIPPKITGSVVCYHASFERGVIEGLCQYLTNNTICDQSIVSHLQGINTHMFDLEKVFKSAYVDRRFRGSTSIKAVQPVLVPTKSYGDLEVVKNGAAATAVYRMWMGGHMSLEDVQKHVDALNVYCERDTEVMVLIMDYLHKIVEMK